MMDGMIVGHVIPAVNSGNYPLKERELKVGDELDLVEVVRCKDCRYALPSSTHHILCRAPFESQYPKAYKDVDWFCKGGERK